MNVPSDNATDSTRLRILAVARRMLFTYGYQALNMDALAGELGMSKKTLYVHFAGKEALAEAVVVRFAEEVRAMGEQIFADDTLGFASRLARFTAELTGRFTRVPPTLFRELERYAPDVYRHIEELRFKNIPIVFGRMIAAGQAAGMVRASIDPGFASEFWRYAIQGLMHPDATERLGLRPDEVFNQALNLFCGGVLTPAGLKDYENVSTS